VAKWLEPTRATDVCTRAADILTKAIAKKAANTVLQHDPWPWRNGLAMLARWMEPVKAAEIWAKIVEHLITAMVATQKAQSDERIELADRLAMVARQIEPSQAAHALIDAITKIPQPQNTTVTLASGFTEQEAVNTLMEALETLTSGRTPEDRERQARAAAFATGILGGPNGLLTGLPLLHPHFYPKPKPMPPQQLVELLKHPFCVGNVRLTVLSALGFTYNREFADQWEFVRFVRENKLPLDLTTPPKRPVSPEGP
jgi:hypothetical protein